MNLNLEGQSVAVFGAARGIGRAIADGFVAEGCAVRGFDREKTAEFVTAGDVASYEAVKSFAGEFERVDHVVFCVGIGSGKFGFPFWNLEPGDWARVLEVNLIGAVNVAHAFAPKLIESGGGSMLFLVSVAGQMGSQTDPPYSASKAALINFTQCAAKDLGPHNVRVNALAPGMVKTELNQSIWAAGQKKLPEDKRRKAHRKQRLKQYIGNPLSLRFPLFDPERLLQWALPWMRAGATTASQWGCRARADRCPAPCTSCFVPTRRRACQCGCADPKAASCCRGDLRVRWCCWPPVSGLRHCWQCCAK